ncbi:MAG: YhcH/YjgK/YiaL family protein [Planctomycetota bacterium]|nr:MAG: YhcH/YjgK/YiaL family protein [Planctomycetota bacterium]
MILTSLHDADRYSALHPGFPAAFEFLRTGQCESLPPGKHTLDGDRLFMLIAEDAGRGRAGAPLEAHRRYIDIQYVVRGVDTMGWRPLEKCERPRSEFDAAKDIVFFDDAPVAWFDVPAGTFTIFFPHDAHAPLAGDAPPRKAVVKVAVEW